MAPELYTQVSHKYCINDDFKVEEWAEASVEFHLPHLYPVSSH
jgi:hypothetical protein